MRAPGAFDDISLGNVLGTGGPAPGARDRGGVQVGDGELGPEHPGEFGRRVEVVQRLDADGVEEVMGLAVPVQGIHDQFGLHDGAQPVRVGDARPARRVLDEVADLEAGVSVVRAQVLMRPCSYRSPTCPRAR